MSTNQTPYRVKSPQSPSEFDVYTRDEVDELLVSLVIGTFHYGLITETADSPAQLWGTL